MKKSNKHSHAMIDHQYGFDGDGVVEHFYQMIWTKDPVFGTIPSVYIPNTVVIRYNQIMSWYFMKKNALRKKTKKNLTREHIKEVFLKQKSPCGIVAVFMRYTFDDKTEESIVENEYLNEKDFIKFVDDEYTISSGILQQFVQPKGEKNWFIRANWSPKLCLFDKVESTVKLNNPRYDVYDRAITYEAETYHSKEVPVRGYVVPNKLERICSNIAQHVQNVTMENVIFVRMVLHFKIDEQDRIWMLMCTSLRTSFETLDKKVPIKKMVAGELVEMHYKPEDCVSKIRIPKDIRTNITKGRPIDMRKRFACISCENKMEPDAVSEVAYKTIIEGYEWDHLQEGDRKQLNAVINANPVNIEERYMPGSGHQEADRLNTNNQVVSLVPPLIRKIFPKLKDDMYKILRKDVAFMKKTAIFCEECVLRIHESQEKYLKAQKQSQKELFGTGRLKPELTNWRMTKTLRNINNPKENTLSNFNTFMRQTNNYGTLRATLTERKLSTVAGHKRISSLPRKSELPLLFGDIEPIQFIAEEADLSNLSLDTSGSGSPNNANIQQKLEQINQIQTNTARNSRSKVSILRTNVKQRGREKTKSIQIDVFSPKPPSLEKPRISAGLATTRVKRIPLLEELANEKNAFRVTSTTTSTLHTEASQPLKPSPLQPLSARNATAKHHKHSYSDLSKTLSTWIPKQNFLRKELNIVKSNPLGRYFRTQDAVDEIFDQPDLGPERTSFYGNGMNKERNLNHLYNY